MKKYTFLFFAIALLAAIFGFDTPAKISVEGVWSVVQVQTVNAGKITSSVFPKQSQVIFTPTHYSFCWTSDNAIARSWVMTEPQKLYRYNQSLVNAGSYTMEDSVLTTKASFASNAMFINGLAKFKCTLRKDTLTLTGISVVAADNTLHPAYASGSHFVTKLVRVKN